ncbi:MAG: hypothetical protein WDZ76_04420 [Pseudohongiellaceae bacterium]
MNALLPTLADRAELLLLSLRNQLGRRFIVVPALVLVWPVFNWAITFLFGGTVNFDEEEAQNVIIGLPLYVLAVALGSGIICKELEQRTLEVVYTIPGGARRVWMLKLYASVVVILVAEALMAVMTWLVFTDYSLASLLGAFRGALFFLVLSMGIGALVRSELFAAMLSGAICWGVFIFSVSFGDSRWSPLFDPAFNDEITQLQILAWSVQNTVGMTLMIIAITALTFARAERREKMLDY